jgi:hypothetical protein
MGAVHRVVSSIQIIARCDLRLLLPGQRGIHRSLLSAASLLFPSTSPVAASPPSLHQPPSAIRHPPSAIRC